MLTIKALQAGDNGAYYVQSMPDGPAEYYRDGQAAGRWLGAGAARLGLDGPVDGERFARALAGADPASGEMLVSGRAASKGRTPDYDLTFSAPKSVTLLSVLSDPQVGEQVRAAHRKAVADTMAMIETEVAAARRGNGGARQLPVELVAAAFDHHTSRALDPQLHTHVVVANMGYAADGRWSALHGQRFYGWAKAAGYLYQAALRAELSERLGVTWGRVRNGVAEVDGFTRPQIEAFSQRRAEIQAELDRAGQSSARSAQLASWATRAAKVKAPQSQLVAGWQRRAAEAGITPGQVEAMAPHRDPDRRLSVPAPSTGERDELVGRLLGPDGLTAQVSVFDRRHVLQGVAEAAHRGAPVAASTALAERVLADKQAVRLAEPTKLGDARYSTVELLETERRLLARAAARRDAQAAVAIPQVLADALSRRPTLSDEQHAMVAALTTSGAGVETVVGVAGAGKTFALDAAREAWQTSGATVIGAALAARAAAELQAGAGIASTTLDRLLIDAERPGPYGGLPHRGVVVIDEAGMVGTRKLARLLEVAERSHTAVVLVGDPRQLPEVEAGGAFAALTKTVPTVELTANRRQSEQWERMALAELRSGRVADAVVAYRDHRRITLAGDAESARDRLVGDWWDARQSGQEAAMYALRRSDVDDLNRRARQRFAEAGRLAGEPLVAGGRPYQLGDEVMAARNDRRLGVRNGTRGQVVAVDHQSRSVTVDTGDGGQLVLPGDYLDAGQLGYGYATTVHKAQGATVDRAFVLGSDALYREAGYVAMSRARARTDLYAVANPDPPEVDDHRRRSEPEPGPIARLAVELSRSQAQQLASEPPRPGDPPPSLADLEDERQRLRSVIGPPPPRPDRDAEYRLDAAREARRDAESRMENVGSLPRRQRALARAAAEIAWGDASLAEWRAAERFAGAEQDRVIWERWAADNAGPLARYRALAGDIDQARRDLAVVALADPAAHHLDLLGPPPLSGTDRHRWSATAADIDGYRQRWQITGPDPLGPRPAGDAQTRDRNALERGIAATRRHIDRSLDRELDRGMGL